jgi:hypothetical protein
MVKQKDDLALKARFCFHGPANLESWNFVYRYPERRDSTYHLHPIEAKSWFTRQIPTSNVSTSGNPRKNKVQGCFERTRKAFKTSSFVNL